MTDPNGPAAWNPGGWPQQPGSQQPGSQQPGPQQPGPDQTWYPGQGSDPNQPYPGYPQQGGYPGYAETQYPGQQPYPGQPYPTQQYPGQPQQGSYPGYPTQQAGAETYAAYGQPPPGYPGAYGAPPPQRTSKVWIIVAAVVAAVAVAAGVVVVVLLNRAPDPTVAIAQAASAPGTEIPDGSTAGLTDTITLDGGDSTVGRLDVSIRFEHRYPSEITGVLTSPGGRRAVVVARGPETSLRLTTNEPASPLQNLVGEPVSGPWKLTLVDGVNVDAGRLVSWDVAAYPAAGDAPAPVATPQSGTSTPGLLVPDDSEVGVTDTITLGGYGEADRITVSARITHDVPSDLVIALRAPTGQSVTLADNDSDGTYTFDSSGGGSSLSALVGEPVAGPWELGVVDDVILDEGTLDSWEITVNG